MSQVISGLKSISKLGSKLLVNTLKLSSMPTQNNLATGSTIKMTFLLTCFSLLQLGVISILSFPDTGMSLSASLM
jgi:hypothetical protein